MSEVFFKLTTEVAIALWRAARSEELGLKVPIQRADVEKVRRIMYEARQEANDDSIKDISILVMPGATEILLLKKAAELP